jgi:hypothetical protein
MNGARALRTRRPLRGSCLGTGGSGDVTIARAYGAGYSADPIIGKRVLRGSRTYSRRPARRNDPRSPRRGVPAFGHLAEVTASFLADCIGDRGDACISGPNASRVMSVPRRNASSIVTCISWSDAKSGQFPAAGDGRPLTQQDRSNNCQSQKGYRLDAEDAKGTFQLGRKACSGRVV